MTGRRPSDAVAGVDVAVDQPFAEPWQARIFATAVLACEQLGRPWDDFRDLLKATIADDPERPYFESFTLALDRLTDVTVDDVTVDRTVRSTDGMGR